MKRSLLLSVLVTCFSCSKPLPQLDQFDQQVWKEDLKGCKGTRVDYLKAIEGQRDKLKGLSEGDVVSLLGKPDRSDLSEHHQKFYRYYIEPSPECKGDSSTIFLEVRFNATGVSREVSIIAID